MGMVCVVRVVRVEYGGWRGWGRVVLLGSLGSVLYLLVGNTLLSTKGRPIHVQWNLDKMVTIGTVLSG